MGNFALLYNDKHAAQHRTLKQLRKSVNDRPQQGSFGLIFPLYTTRGTIVEETCEETTVANGRRGMKTSTGVSKKMALKIIEELGQHSVISTDARTAAAAEKAESLVSAGRTIENFISTSLATFEILDASGDRIAPKDILLSMKRLCGSAGGDEDRALVEHFFASVPLPNQDAVEKILSELTTAGLADIIQKIAARALRASRTAEERFKDLSGTESVDSARAKASMYLEGLKASQGGSGPSVRKRRLVIDGLIHDTLCFFGKSQRLERAPDQLILAMESMDLRGRGTVISHAAPGPIAEATLDGNFVLCEAPERDSARRTHHALAGRCDCKQPCLIPLTVESGEFWTQTLVWDTVYGIAKNHLKNDEATVWFMTGMSFADHGNCKNNDSCVANQVLVPELRGLKLCPSHALRQEVVDQLKRA
jgi:hypothetical protein